MQNTIRLMNFNNSGNLPENMTLTAPAANVKRTLPVLGLPVGLERRDVGFVVSSATNSHRT